MEMTSGIGFAWALTLVLFAAIVVLVVSLILRRWVIARRISSAVTPWASMRRASAIAAVRPPRQSSLTGVTVKQV